MLRLYKLHIVSLIKIYFFLAKMDYINEVSRFFNENLNVVWWLALFLGAWTVLAEVYRLVHFVYAKLIRKRKNLKERYGSGKWALITGSS